MTSSLSVVTLASVFTISSYDNSALNVKGDSCVEHVGYHYGYKAPEIGLAGHQEFWACCKCHQQFLEQPSGNFTDSYDFYMTGGIDEHHIAYIPPLEGGIFGRPEEDELDHEITGFEW